MLYFLIGVAGGCGAILRYLIGRATMNLAWAALPFGTLIANLLGCFLIGYLSWSLVHKWQLSQDLQVVVLTGFLGGFTTFSAFSLETVRMFENGPAWQAISYVALKVTLCIVMCFVGLLLAKQT
ncbi:MAG: CrcB protein [Pseudoalteromonas tetraodonis]|jgi:CrcB protein